MNLGFLLTLCVLSASEPVEDETPSTPEIRAAIVKRMAQTAAAHYKLDDVQTQVLEALLDERVAEEMKLAADLEAHFHANPPPFIGDPIAVEKYAPVRKRGHELAAEMGRHRAETAALIRRTVLDEAGRKLFDEDMTAGTGPFRAFAERKPRLPNSGPWDQEAWDRASPVRRYTGRGLLERMWLAYVAAVEDSAKFDADQRRRAYDHLRSAFAAAAAYRTAKEKDYAEIAVALAAVESDVPDPRRLAAVESAARQLGVPLDAVFAQLRNDVDALLSAPQRGKVRTSQHPLLRALAKSSNDR